MQGEGCRGLSTLSIRVNCRDHMCCISTTVETLKDSVFSNGLSVGRWLRVQDVVKVWIDAHESSFQYFSSWNITLFIKGVLIDVALNDFAACVQLIEGLDLMFGSLYEFLE